MRAGWLIIFVLAGIVFAQSPKIAKQWERAIVLRLGRYTGMRGPGLFWITPFIETVSIYIDQRVITTSFAAEETLTSDTVPVNVDAVLFWMVHDSEKAALEVQDYTQAAKSYQNNPTALHLRAMNILYEGLKEKGALMLVPSTAVESMGLGGLMGAAALRQQTLSEGNEPARPPAAV
jgi:regulator of protease activity HflC (stomatin/prohibitin superfamily)